ncbi:MAG: glycerol-3-phosphate 1-O-acyltransferase PlsY [Gemmatimonadaceae bacterium]|nr:glycerol-3-phosphate 1-O-acyltransferase PlsY [Gemmatimonadaceae bacterium]
MHPAAALALAYAAGSVPSAYLAGRLLKGVDLRTVGSGNLGATNVYRNLGPTAALVVLLADAAKGALPVALLPARIDPAFAAADGAMLWWALGCGVAAIVGHAKPVFLLWKGGGKGVATAAGIFGALAPAALGVALALFAGMLWRFKFVSLASISAALVLPLAVALTLGTRSPVFVLACLIGLFVVWSHRSNIQRLRAGTEPRLARTPKEGAS